MAQGKRLPDMRGPDDFDELDTQILAAYEVEPSASTREVADKVGCSHDTVWKRIRRIRRSDWVDQMRQDLKCLAPKIQDAIKEGLELGDWKDRSSVAVRLLSGLGVLVDKQERRVSLDDATPEQIAKAIERLSDDDLARLIARRRTPGGA